MAIRLRSIPLFGTGIVSKSRVSTAQRRLNVYYEIRGDKDKSRFAIYGTPGLKLLFTIPGNVPVRGMLGVEDTAYMIVGSIFQATSTLPPFTTKTPPSGGLESRAGNVTMATDNVNVLIADGTFGTIYNIANNTLNSIGGSFPNNAKTITFVDGFFVAEQPGTQRFWVSNVNDGTTWGGLGFATAGSDSGNVLAVDSISGNLIVFSSDHIEFWQNVGSQPEPFAPIISAASQYGIGAIFSRAHLDDTMCFLCINREGQYQVAQIAGYQINIISTPDLDSLINSFSTVEDAVAYSYGIDSHRFYQITFPTANRSFIYDGLTQVWGEAQTGTSIVPSRHIGNLNTLVNSGIIISDYKNGNIYQLDPNSYTDNGVPIVREIVTRHTLGDFNRVRIAQLYLDMETGVGLVSGPGSDPQIMLSYSKDNGRTWSGERWKSLGKMGEYNTRVWWRRFGSTRDAVFKIRMTDPVKFVITDAAMRIREKGSNPNRAQSQGRME